jgi:hypothetical protein
LPPKRKSSEVPDSATAPVVPPKPTALQKPDPNRIFLIDAMSFIFRAYHAMAR